MFGFDVVMSSYVTIGGMIGNNSVGVHSILYGCIVENLVVVEVVFVDGSVHWFVEGSCDRDFA
jgi:FAD/FMN-containing dehydrogenases